MSTYKERYDTTNQNSTHEIYVLIENRKEKGKETGVAERIYTERTGRTWQQDRDFKKALEKVGY